MEGTLLVPPDRGTIIGRAIWKPRFVVVGNPQRDAQQTNLSLSKVISNSTSRIKDMRSSGSSKMQQKPAADTMYLSIYKSKEDWESIQQHSMASITECQVQMVAHRKQGPVLPTLIIQVSPDPTTDKLRKRRSSRTAGLTSTKESGPTTLWFRPGDDQYTLQDWARYIASLIQPRVPSCLPMSPISPSSPTFINPFSPRSTRDVPETFPPPPSKKSESPRTAVHHHHHKHSIRTRGATYSSGSPSVRSGRSDISHTSSMNPSTATYSMHGQNYTTVRPTDLPSPATTVGEFQGECMLGWTSAQGRSSTLSSPVRGESIGSQAQAQAAFYSSSPPIPRETILDRAFQMKCIPGSDREIPGEEKLSSLARFDALMREAEARRKTQVLQPKVMSPTTSTWDDEDSDKEDVNDDDDDESDDEAFDHDIPSEQTAIGPSAKRVLTFIANRHSAVSHSASTSLSLPTDSQTLDYSSSVSRPHTSHSKSRPDLTQRTTSQPHFTFPISEQPTAKIPDDSLLQRINHEKRNSTSSTKRLSFNEFTKRLSSTSSLLLVQTNVSGGSSGNEMEAPQQTTSRGALNPRAVPRPSQDRERDDRCGGWRGSVGVFGGVEGGFL